MDGSLGLELPDLLSGDAPAGPEFVGGPLVGPAGTVIGMAVLGRASYGVTNIGLEGAIPIDRARSIATIISSGKRPQAIHIGPTAMLGVTLEPGDLYEGLTTGVTVLTVVPGSQSTGRAPPPVTSSSRSRAKRSPRRPISRTYSSRRNPASRPHSTGSASQAASTQRQSTSPPDHPNDHIPPPRARQQPLIFSACVFN
jgi:hypothetical protein